MSRRKRHCGQNKCPAQESAARPDWQKNHEALLDYLAFHEAWDLTNDMAIEIKAPEADLDEDQTDLLVQIFKKHAAQYAAVESRAKKPSINQP